MRLFSTPNSLFSLGLNQSAGHPKSVLRSDAHGSKAAGRLEAKVSFCEIYLQRDEFLPQLCTRWHVSMTNSGAKDIVITGWELITYRNFIQRSRGAATKLDSDVGAAIRVSPPRPDYPGRLLAVGESIQVFVVTEPNVDTVERFPIYLRITYSGGTKHLRLRYWH